MCLYSFYDQTTKKGGNFIALLLIMHLELIVPLLEHKYLVFMVRQYMLK